VDVVRLIDAFYTRWDTVEPDQGYDARAAPWRARLDPIEPDAEQP
jgi:hypothetical protein